MCRYRFRRRYDRHKIGSVKKHLLVVMVVIEPRVMNAVESFVRGRVIEQVPFGPDKGAALLSQLRGESGQLVRTYALPSRVPVRHGWGALLAGVGCVVAAHPVTVCGPHPVHCATGGDGRAD